MNESHWEYDYIHMEVFSGTMPTIEQTGYLLDNGADINAMDENGHTALYSSIECECHYDFEKVKYLLSRGASTKCGGFQFIPLLFHVKNLEQIKILVEEYGISVDELYHDEGMYEESGKDCCTRLFDAIIDMDFEIVKFLVENGANVNHEDYSGRTPLCYASGDTRFMEENDPAYVERDNEEIIKYLIEKGSIVDNKDDCSLETPLFAANPVGARVLLENGANVNSEDCMGRTPLFYSNPMVTRILLENGASVNHLDGAGKTPLFDFNIRKDCRPGSDARAYENQVSVARILLENGADVKHEDYYGLTPLDYGDMNCNIVRIFMSWRISMILGGIFRAKRVVNMLRREPDNLFNEEYCGFRMKKLGMGDDFIENVRSKRRKIV